MSSLNCAVDMPKELEFNSWSHLSVSLLRLVTRLVRHALPLRCLVLKAAAPFSWCWIHVKSWTLPNA